MLKQATFLIVFILLLPLFSFAQRAVMSTDQTRILYKWISSKISIAVPGYPCSDLELQSATCKIEGEGCSFLVTPDSLGLAVFIVRSKKNNKAIDTIKVPVIHFPDPRVIIARGKNNTGPIIKDGPIIVSEHGAFVDSFFHITGFRVSIIHSNNEPVYEHTTIGSRFEPETITVIEKAKPGDKLFIEDIYVVGPDNKRRIFNSISYLFK